MMSRKTGNDKMLHRLPGAMALFLLMLLSAVSPALAGTAAGQKRFDSPQLAADALADAVRAEGNAELLVILGPASEDLVSSGDPVADRNGRERFLKAYQAKHEIDQGSDTGTAILLVGVKDYPFPIPIVRQDEFWFFDTPAGMEEILNRRIGRNELHTIEVMQAYTDAQREYACMRRNGGDPEEFAQKLASSEGRKDGLYWTTAPGEKESPFGPLIARAAEEGYSGGLDRDPPEPYRGYYFKILKGQGEHAGGGAFDYVADGRMVLGFGLVAFPAKYGASGIMTFVVNQEGVIYEKDLGKETAAQAAAMTLFDPDETWRKYAEPAGQ
jgi:hypothetical protein